MRTDVRVDIIDNRLVKITFARMGKLITLKLEAQDADKLVRLVEGAVVAIEASRNSAGRES